MFYLTTLTSISSTSSIPRSRSPQTMQQLSLSQSSISTQRETKLRSASSLRTTLDLTSKYYSPKTSPLSPARTTSTRLGYSLILPQCRRLRIDLKQCKMSIDARFCPSSTTLVLTYIQNSRRRIASISLRTRRVSIQMSRR